MKKLLSFIFVFLSIQLFLGCFNQNFVKGEKPHEPENLPTMLKPYLVGTHGEQFAKLKWQYAEIGQNTTLPIVILTSERGYIVLEYDLSELNEDDYNKFKKSIFYGGPIQRELIDRVYNEKILFNVMYVKETKFSPSNKLLKKYKILGKINEIKGTVLISLDKNIDRYLAGKVEIIGLDRLNQGKDLTPYENLKIYNLPYEPNK